MTLLSVVVPIREMAGKLTPLFEWVKIALNYGCEVILIHDFADSRTEDELSKFVSLHSSDRLIFVSTSLNSPGLARNEGIMRISGDYVAFWDSDDLPDVIKIVHVAQECKNTDFEIGIGGFLILDESNRVLNRYPTSSQDCLQKIAMYPGLWRMVFKSSIVKNVKFTDLLLAEDQIFLAMLKPAQKRIMFSDQIVYGYVAKREGALTTRRMNISDLIQAVGFLTVLLKDGSYKPDFEFNLALAVKNCLTVLKIGTNLQRIKAISILHRILLRHFASAIGVVFLIIRFKRKEKNR
jgi:glycosyltransferase involved in cell wall biosynthesis